MEKVTEDSVPLAKNNPAPALNQSGRGYYCRYSKELLIPRIFDGGLSGGQQITATAKYTILRCSGPVKSTNGGFRPALTALPSTSRAERKITAEFFPLRAECINTGIACEFLRPLNLLIVLFGIESAVPVPKGVDISSAIISLYRKHTHSYISVSNCP